MTLDLAAARLAVLGLRDAYSRHFALAHSTMQDEDSMIISAVDFVNWACALDEVLRETDPGYAQRRDADSDGRVLPGLRYVRDRHMHQVVVSMRGDGVAFFGAFPPSFSAGVVWRPASEIAAPTGRHATAPSVQQRRTVYEQNLQIQPAWIGLRAALSFLTAEAQSRQVALPPWQEP